MIQFSLLAKLLAIVAPEYVVFHMIRPSHHLLSGIRSSAINTAAENETGFLVATSQRNLDLLKMLHSGNKIM